MISKDASRSTWRDTNTYEVLMNPDEPVIVTRLFTNKDDTSVTTFNVGVTDKTFTSEDIHETFITLKFPNGSTVEVPITRETYNTLVRALQDRLVMDTGQQPKEMAQRVASRFLGRAKP